MALTVKIGLAGSEVDLTAYLVYNSQRVEQRADAFVSTCSFQLIDKTADVGLAFSVKEKDSVLIADGATKYFSGTVANVDTVVLAEGTEALIYTIECQDYNLLVEEVVIDQVETYGGVLDSTIIDDLFDKYLPEINSHAPGGSPPGYVQSLHVFAELELVDISLRAALDRIASEVESTALAGYWYIDFDKNLHYYNIEDNAPAWYLSDNPTVVPDATNLVENPSFEVNITDFWTNSNWATAEQSSTYARFGGYSVRLYDASVAINDWFACDSIAISPNTEYSFSAWVKKIICTGTGRIGLNWYTAGDTLISGVPIYFDSGTHDWQEYKGTGTSPPTAAKCRFLLIGTGLTAGTEAEIFMDAVQVELGGEATPYLDGSLGPGYAWTGTPHNSTSTRTGVNSYSYLSDVSRSRQGSSIANRILVVGAEMALFVQDSDSYNYYGKWFETVVRDNTLFSVDEVLSHGYSLLAKWAYPDEVFTIRTRKEGLRAGMNVRFESGLFGTETKTNLVRNPSFEVNVADSWTFTQDGSGGSVAQSAVRAAVGTQSCLMTASDSGSARLRSWSGAVLLADGETITIQARVYRPVATTCGIEIIDVSTPAHRGGLAATLTAGWQILTISWTNDTAGPVNIQLGLYNNGADGVAQVWFDGCMAQIDKGPYPLDYIDGTFPFCDWSDAAHNSYSSRLPVFTVRTLTLTWPEDTLTFELELGGKASASSLISSRTQGTNTVIGGGPTTPGQLPVSSRGWSHTLVFTATDYQTVAWGSGTIETADGTVYSIVAGNTGVMAAPTYIFLDTDTSLTVLQTAGSPAVGRNMILICVAEDVVDVENKATIQAFGGQGIGVMIGADNIIAAAITANEIAANTILAGNIAAGAIETDQLYAGAVTAAKIATNTITATKLDMGMGDSIYNLADGLLLLGPNCEINTTEWWSLRRQLATISGAFRRIAGYWPGSAALAVEIGATNLVLNPSFEVNITDFWNTFGWATAEQSEEGEARFGEYSVRLYDASSGADESFYSHKFTVSPTTDYTFSVWVKKTICTGTGQMFVSWFTAGDAPISSDSLSFDSGTHGWKRYQITAESPGTAAKADINIFDAVGITVTTELEGFVDGVQFEESAYVTPYCDGAQGSGYAWSGTEHNSTSVRTATEVNLDDLAYLVTDNPTLSFRVVVQMPYDADGTWSEIISYIFDTRGADNNNRVFLYYSATIDEFYVYLNGATRITNGTTQTFKAGDWVDIVLTVDFTADEYYTYVNGILDGSDTTALAAPTLTDWCLGSDYLGANQVGLVFAEYAVFDRVLTSDEVAALYALYKPIIDIGSIDAPGIYILDGRFRISSSLTGNRIEMTANGIEVYDSAGALGAYLSKKGLRLRGESTTTVHEIHWEDDTGYKLGAIQSSWAGGGNKAITVVTANRPTGAPWGTNTDLLLRAYDEIAGDYCGIWIHSEGGIVVGTIAGGGSGLYFQIDGPSSDVFTVDGDGSIRTRFASSAWWRFGTADSGTGVTPNYKIHVEIDGTWYTFLAEQGSV